MIINRLLRKNTPPARIAGFVLSNFIGLAIVVASTSVLSGREIDIFRRRRLHKRKTISWSTRRLRRQIRSKGKVKQVFRRGDFRPRTPALGEEGGTILFCRLPGYGLRADRGRGTPTYMFFESIPSEFIDVAGSQWATVPAPAKLVSHNNFQGLSYALQFRLRLLSRLPQLSESFMEEFRCASTWRARTASGRQTSADAS